MNIDALYRYPLKGFSAESLQHVTLTPRLGMPFDRAYAITHGNSKYDHGNPAWISRRNFLVVAHSPLIASSVTRFNDQTRSLSIELNGNILFDASLEDHDVDSALEAALAELGVLPQPGPYRLVVAGKTSLTDSPDNSVSLMNTRSLEELEQELSCDLFQQRFRGNIWFTGRAPWQENDWLGREVRIGDSVLRVREPIERCAAVDANPHSGKRDHDVLRSLNRSMRQNLFGVLADVVEGGSIEVGSSIALQ